MTQIPIIPTDGLHLIDAVRETRTSNDLPGVPHYLLSVIEDTLKAPNNLEKMLAPMIRSRDRLVDGRKKDLLQWKIETLTKQTQRASQEAYRRKMLIRKLANDPKAQEEEKERCRDGAAGAIHFINNWCWTVDPRARGIAIMPMRLFGFQEDLIRWLYKLIFEEQVDGYLDKSRDMGATWTILAFGVHAFIFEKRFEALYGSRKEELVDTRGEMDSLFEKLRFMMRMLPDWMLPKGFDRVKDCETYMKIINPETGSYLTGESSNPDFGRAGRYTAIFLDEFPSFPHGGYEAWGACSQSSPCKIPFGTPKGHHNKAYELKCDSEISQFSCHWKEHPWKDNRWYEGQKMTMNAMLIAQELDIDYDASQPGQILPMYKEIYSVITRSEFADFYGEIAYDEKGRVIIPKHWQLAMACDWGNTEDHRCAIVWVARPADYDPLCDAVFVYREYIAPVGASIGEVARAIRKLEAPQREHHRIVMRLIGHEASSQMNTFIKDYGMSWKKWDTEEGYNQGIGQLQNYFDPRPIPHPFRSYLTKRPRIYFLVDDDQGAVLKDEFGKHKEMVKPAKDENGLMRLRMEVPRYHYPQSEQGKAVQMMRPFKKFDDALDALRALAAHWFPNAVSRSIAEIRERRLRKELQLENMRHGNISMAEMGNLVLSRQMALSDMKEADQMDGRAEEGKHWRDALIDNAIGFDEGGYLS